MTRLLQLTQMVQQRANFHRLRKFSPTERRVIEKSRGRKNADASTEVKFKQRKLEHFIEELLQKLASFFAINIMHLIQAET